MKIAGLVQKSRVGQVSGNRYFFLGFKTRAGTGRDFVPEYQSPFYSWGPVTIVFWTCA